MAEFLNELGYTMLGFFLSWQSRMALMYLTATLVLVFGL